ncbi:MAG: ral secretion pathway protein [Gammaproteobacteria bacterium]|jgi:general secretion pathway protein A|nr:ral secretion pathway protein [Gammaproteobacteria bacterium]
MYLSFFGLNEKPFAITPDPRYLYLSERHAEALAHLLYGINEAGGFVQLTGEVGTGKTTIVRSLLAQTPKNAEIALILNPKMTAPEFLLTICEELGIGVPDSATESLKDLVDILSGYLLRAHAGGRRVVVVVDEAQNLAPSVLEQVRLLTNLETNTRKLLQIILIGQPELRELLGRNELRQLAQRITGRYHLNPLTHDETAAYVRHRLRVAGATSDIFSPTALTEVYRLAVGVPRVINVVCDRALLGAYSMDRHRVTASLVRHAATEVFGKRFSPRWLPWLGTAAAAALLVTTTILLWNFRPWGSAFHPAAAGAAGTRDNVAQATRLIPPPVIPGALSQVTAKDPSGTRSAFSGHELTELLAKHAGETDTDSAFSKLFGLWRIQYVPAGVDPCSQASNQGLECLNQRGSFGQLRLYNRPAILILNDDAGASHQVVLTALNDEHASIQLGGASHEVSIGELARYWFGDFVMLWRPGTSQVKSLSQGMRGDDVRWLRQSLQRVEGASSDGPVSDVFDADLSKLVRDFQRQHRLTVDGIAGVQTQIVLASAVAPADSPSLYLADAHGG